ncbi:hypothetical protein GCM10027435_00960 [Haloparvum alkalitolerans]
MRIAAAGWDAGVAAPDAVAGMCGSLPDIGVADLACLRTGIQLARSRTASAASATAERTAEGPTHV